MLPIPITASCGTKVGRPWPHPPRPFRGESADSWRPVRSVYPTAISQEKTTCQAFLGFPKACRPCTMIVGVWLEGPRPASTGVRMTAALLLLRLLQPKVLSKLCRYAQATHASDGKTGSPPTVCLVRCSSSRRPVPTSRLPCPVTLESPWASQQIKLAGGFFSTSQASSSAVHGRKKHAAAPRKGRIQTQWDTEKRESVFGCASCFSLFETFSWSRETIIICEPMLHQVIIPLSKKRVPTNKTPGLGVLIVILLCFNTKE